MKAIEVLERGQVVQVVDQRAGRLRLSATSVSGSSPSGPAGWVSIWNKEGATRLLERVHPPEPANFGANFTLLLIFKFTLFYSILLCLIFLIYFVFIRQSLQTSVPLKLLIPQRLGQP
eukprot:SAG31_NODE_1857_length_7062_cov_6.624587_9_plen_118_part_00